MEIVDGAGDRHRLLLGATAGIVEKYAIALKILIDNESLFSDDVPSDLKLIEDEGHAHRSERSCAIHDLKVQMGSTTVS